MSALTSSNGRTRPIPLDESPPLFQFCNETPFLGLSLPSRWCRIRRFPGPGVDLNTFSNPQRLLFRSQLQYLHFLPYDVDPAIELREPDGLRHSNESMHETSPELYGILRRSNLLLPSIRCCFFFLSSSSFTCGAWKAWNAGGSFVLTQDETHKSIARSFVRERLIEHNNRVYSTLAL